MICLNQVYAELTGVNELVRFVERDNSEASVGWGFYEQEVSAVPQREAAERILARTIGGFIVDHIRRRHRLRDFPIRLL